MTVLTAARTADQMLVLLTDVARKASASGNKIEPGHALWTLIEQHASAGHTDETLLLAWTDFADTVADLDALDALDNGVKHWTEVFNREDCGGFNHAIEIISSRVDDAYRSICNGQNGNR